MRVLFGGTPVRSPARVPNAIGAAERLEADGLFQVAQLAFGASQLQPVPVAGYCDSSGIVAAILQATQPFDDDRNYTLLTDVADNATHGETSKEFPGPSLLGQGKRETEFFNYGVGQHFAGDALDLGLRLFAREAAIQRELKILSLAHAIQTLVPHLFQRALNRLALGIENAFLERDVNVGCHKKIIINDGPQTSDPTPRSDVRGPTSVFFSFSSRSASESSSNWRCRGF